MIQGVAEEIIWKHTDEMPVTRTKLLKLMYLCDVESVVKTGHKITSVNWVKYAYGPYSDYVLEEILASDNVVEYAVDTPNGVAYKYDVKVKPDGVREPYGSVVEAVVSEFEFVDTTEVVSKIFESEVVSDVDKYGVIRIDSVDSNPHM